jgi:hypothetical protein
MKIALNMHFNYIDTMFVILFHSLSVTFDLCCDHSDLGNHLLQ